MATQKPDLRRIWAAGAPSGNVVDPDDSSPGKFDDGWLAEVPTFQNFNFLQQLFSQGLAHINEQGIPSWDTDTTYPIFGLAKGSDGQIYVSVIEQSGNNPVGDNGTNWKVAFSTPETLPIDAAQYDVIDGNYSPYFRKESDYTPIPNTTFGIAHTGQSLAEGGVGGDSVSGVGTPAFPDRTLMFSPQPVAYSSNSNSNVPIDLVEVTRVTIGHSLTRTLADGNENTVLFSGQAWGGKAYSEIKKGGPTGVYEKVIQQVVNAEAVYSDIVYLGVTCIHGEQDGLNNNTNYEADLVEWQGDFDTDIKATTGQVEDVIMYLCQTATAGGYGNNGGITETTFPTPLEQLSAHVNNTNIIMACSKYHIPYADHSHITNLAQRILGEYYAKAFAAGTSHEPLRPSNFTLGSNTIVIDFVGNVGNLVFDTSIVQSITDSGFSYNDDSGRTITDVSITGAAQVTITLSGAIGTNAEVAYAYHNGAGGSANQVAGLGDRGNLRDSDTAVSLYDSSPLYNWCVIFKEALN